MLELKGVEMARNYYINQSGRLRRKDNTLYFEKTEIPEDAETSESKLDIDEQEEGKVAIKRIPIPIEDIDSLYLFGEIDLNTRLLNFLAQKQIPVHIFNYYGYYSGTYYPREYLISGFLVVNQVQHYEKKSKRIPIAREFVSAAADNMLKNLQYYTNREKDCSQQISTIKAIAENISTADGISELMGIEGNIRETYYGSLNTILQLETPFEGRKRRPPSNPINALISFGNSMMYTTCLKEIYRTQLDPAISFLHEPGERRFSLSLDLAEIFKPIIVDRLIFRLFNRQQLQESKHFDTGMEGCYLNEEGRKIFIKEFNDQLETTIEHRNLKRKVSYQHLIRLDCYKLIKHLTEMEPYQAFRIWW